MKTYNDYKAAKRQADKTGEPLWDTHAKPDRYIVGHVSVETEEDDDNSDWEQLQ